MDDFDPTDTTTDTRRRELLGFIVLALVAGLMIVIALALGGGVED